jgi:uncharacterized protein YkwD
MIAPLKKGRVLSGKEETQVSDLISIMHSWQQQITDSKSSRLIRRLYPVLGNYFTCKTEARMGETMNKKRKKHQNSLPMLWINTTPAKMLNT